ncbi:MAG: phosphoglycerate mutase family protein [Bacteroidetes bacterium]|nr:phosphoglycerate mutase family protein [Bacteroidota bacterium]
MLIYFLRHGETEYNRLGIVQGSGVDTDLNETGRAQAQAFFETYREMNFQLMVCSALKRSRQTLDPFLETGIPLIENPDINEIGWGDHEGKSSTPERTKVYEWMVNEWKNANYKASLPNGETAENLALRLNRFIDWLKTKPADRLLVCTHGRTLRALITLLKGLELSEMEATRHANTGCYVVELQDGRFHITMENSTAHLMNAGIL